MNHHDWTTGEVRQLRKAHAETDAGAKFWQRVSGRFNALQAEPLTQRAIVAQCHRVGLCKPRLVPSRNDIRACRRAWCGGASYAEIATSYSVSPSTVRKWILS